MKKTATIITAFLLTACGSVASSDWKLTSGQEPYADPDPIVYEGRVELTGWIIEKPAYVGEPVPHFHVADLSKVPGGREDYLPQTSGENMALLMQSTKENPSTVLATKLQVNMEGSPFIYIDQVIK